MEANIQGIFLLLRVWRDKMYEKRGKIPNGV